MASSILITVKVPFYNVFLLFFASQAHTILESFPSFTECDSSSNHGDLVLVNKVTYLSRFLTAML